MRPIFEQSCFRCHGPEKPKSDFRLDLRFEALKGGDDNTNDIVPGHSDQSMLIRYVAGLDSTIQMPPSLEKPLTPSQVAILRAWIDQGALWGTNGEPELAFSFAPELRWIDVHGNNKKFRELEGTHEGFGGGAKHFSMSAQISPDEKLSFEGHVLVPENDLELALALEKNNVGFVHGGFTEWRTYYNDAGGYNPAVTPSEFNLDRDLYVDNGRAWVDLGLTLPRLPQIVLGYEYQFKHGNKSMLDWGYANGKNIYPAVLAVDETTHIVKLDVTHDFHDWHLENNARLEYYSEKNNGTESEILLGGTSPDTFVNTRDDYHSTQGMDTLSLEKQLRDWWFVSTGFYYSKLEASDFFNQTTAIPALNFKNQLSSQQITLRRESEIFSVASLFTPLSYLTFSLGSQNEWTTEEGFGNSIPDLDLGVNTPADSNLNLFKASQDADLRFTKIPFTVLFTDARLDEESVNTFEQQNGNQLVNQNDAMSHRGDVQAGFNTSPWTWFGLNAQYEYQSSDTDYSNPNDVVNGVPGPTNGYPGFILHRKIETDKFVTKLDLRPASWLKTTLSWQIASTDYSSTTDPGCDFILRLLVSPGGPITDGRYHAQTCGFGVTLTPIQKLYFTDTFTYSHSHLDTANNGDPSIVPYTGDIYTLATTATYSLNAKTRLQTTYAFSHANYSEDNAAAGSPLGLDFTRHELLVGLTREITRRLSGGLRYQFSEYSEPSSGNANNFTAHGIFATVAYKWP
ncbi:MAG TPA: c-type cytochrome domain-containing protein [Verrucomicrobiae bacterium]|nr:c-type cytochrome domain-containing protein [Verrucomicrobiae bacterium]